MTDFAERKSQRPRKTANGMRQSSRPLPKSSLPAFRRFWKGMGPPARVLPPSSALIRAENLRPGIFGCQNAGRKAHGLDGGMIEAKFAADIAAMHA